MNEHDLHGLASSPSAAIPDCRPIGDVIARGTRLRRRHHATRAAGATAMVGGFAAASVLAVRDGPDTTTAPEQTSPPAGQLLPVPDVACGGGGDPVTLEEAEPLRMLPADLPDGLGIDWVSAQRVRPSCPVPDPALVMTKTDEEGRITATVSVNGPFERRPDLAAYMGPQPRIELQFEAIPVRGGDGAIAGWRTDGLVLIWTEPDGATWYLKSRGLEGEPLLDMAEKLVLDSRAGSGAVAVVPADALGPGWEVAWQDPDAPVPGRETRLFWHIQVTDGRCVLILSEVNGVAPVAALYASPNRALTTIGGEQALVSTQTPGDVGLLWNATPTALGELSCNDMDVETAVGIAESLAPVPVGDPRLKLQDTP